MRFKTVFHKGEKYLIKIELEENKEVWATTTEAVYNFANKNFKPSVKGGFPGEECDCEYTEKNNQYHVTRILKLGAETSANTDEPKPTPVENREDDKKYCKCGEEIKNHKYDLCYACNKKSKSTDGKFYCEDCNKELKDGKYKKCYDCNKKNPPKSYGGSSNGKNQDLIVKQAIMKAVCSAMPIFAGQVSDVEVVGQMINELFDKVYKKVTE